MPLHVDNASAADGTLVGILHVFAITSMMYTVTTLHEHHSLRRREHILPTYRAVTVSRAFNAAMGVSNRYSHAHTTSLIS